MSEKVKENKNIKNKEPKEKEGKSKKKIIIISLISVLIISVVLSGVGYILTQSIPPRGVSDVEFTVTSTELLTDSDYKKAVRKQKVPFYYRMNREVKKDQQDIQDVSRKSSVKVDVGFDSTEETLPEGKVYNGTTNIEREYWAYTNMYSQLVWVHADNIIPQNESKEKDWMLGGNRYSPSQASVDGLNEGVDDYGDFNDPKEYHLQSRLDRGHSIADSLGGNSTSYNITPQASSLNEDYPGPWRDMEMEVLRHGGVEQFTEHIEYVHPWDNIPEKYEVSYIINNSSGQRIYKEYTMTNINNYDTFI